MSTPTAIKVLSTPPLRSVLAEIRPQFEHAAQQALVVEIGPVAELKRRIDGGVAFDVAILTSVLIDGLVHDGTMLPSTRCDIARAGLGAVVRTGATKPDIASVDAFRGTLLSAKSILYASGSAVRAHIENLFERLGIADSIRLKQQTLPAGGYIAKAVADGIADLGLTTIPTILETAGVDLAWSFPAPLQFYVDLSGGMSTRSMRPEGARMLLKTLMESESLPILRGKGLEPVFQ